MTYEEYKRLTHKTDKQLANDKFAKQLLFDRFEARLDKLEADTKQAIKDILNDNRY